MSDAKEWSIEIDGDHVEVHRRGAWYSDADDLDDAIGILQGQRATSVAINDNGYLSWRRL